MRDSGAIFSAASRTDVNVRGFKDFPVLEIFVPTTEFDTTIFDFEEPLTFVFFVAMYYTS